MQNIEPWSIRPDAVGGEEAAQARVKVAGGQESEAGLGIELLAGEAEDAAGAGASPHLAEHVVVGRAGEGAAEVVSIFSGYSMPRLDSYLGR